MIRAVTVINHLDETTKFVLADPTPLGLYVKNIEGLGPGKATINSMKFASGDGTVYNSAHVEPRTITFTFGVTPGTDAELARQASYRIFPLKKEITMLFESDNRECFCRGHVEANEPQIFEQSVAISVSVKCDDPYFYATNNMYVLNGTENIFEFPFSNESQIEDLITFAELRYDVGAPIYYDGDADSGCIITIECSGEVSGLAIRNIETGEEMTFDTSKLSYIVGDSTTSLLANDKLVINTMYNEKAVTLVRNGIKYNCVGCLPKNTPWLMLHSGVNTFGYSADIGMYNAAIDIKSYVLYSGV